MRADRLLAMLFLLQARQRLTARELAERLEVSERTIYRDIDALSASGVPIYAERGPGGGVSLLEGYQTRLTGLTEPEVQALSMFNVPGSLGDLGLSKALETALLKLSAALPAMHRHSAERVRQRVHLDTARWFAPKEKVPHLHALHEAVWEDRRLAIRYCKDNGEVVERLLEPYGLVAKVGIWYVVASTSNGWRVYRVSRVQDAEVLPERFTRDAQFDLVGYWQAWCAAFEESRPRFNVTLRCSMPDALPRVLGEWVREIVTDAPWDDAGRKTFSLLFESEMHAVSAVLSLGSLVEVLEPSTLRHAVVRVAHEVLAAYGPEPVPFTDHPAAEVKL
jgi:predicted DNA-binding transcriptional regulator YafY